MVDTCVVLDVLEDDATFGRRSALCLARLLSDGLVLCPGSYVELAPAFNGSLALQDEFLAGLGAPCSEPWTSADTRAAHVAWGVQVARRRQGLGKKRPVADVLIGAFALRFRGLVTRSTGDFAAAFPGLPLVDPAA